MGSISGSAPQKNAGHVPARRRTKKPAVTRELTRSEITTGTIKILTYGGWICWQQHNVRAVRGRTFKGRKGVCDILGFNKFTGLFLACEVKTLRDKLSAHQIIFLTEVTSAGGLALVAHQDHAGNVILTEFKNMQ